MTKGRTTTRVSLRLKDEDLELATRRAKGKGLTVSEWIRRLVRRELGLQTKI